ncbi:unnamed protein product [Haemonchus placei]|uniref:Selenoprotein n=1 Tax=Haemonchus placei TaxID=6290 RepID=A0A0N4X7A3_HAEPC|nr:unnamed protein product [Haemonchus placei]
MVFTELQSTLEDKAQKAIPLLEKLVALLTPDPAEIVEADERARSVVIFGVPEGDADHPSSMRQKSAEQAVSEILDFLDV